MADKMVRDNDKLNFHIALFSPEIPANTGNIGRICVGCNSMLHLIKPIRFLLTDKQLKRAGLDYWDNLLLEIHEDMEKFLQYSEMGNVYFCTTKGKHNYADLTYRKGDFFLFGPETKGLPEDLLNRFKDRTIKIPMSENIRSLNLANSVSVIIYEAWRQTGFQ